MKKYLLLFSGLFLFSILVAQNKERTLWQIGTADYSTAEFALAPGNYKDFLKHDFGFEDRFFIAGGYSDPKTDFPYVLPGPVDTWGGTWTTAGWRTHEVNILFGLKDIPEKGNYMLYVNLLDFSKNFPPTVKVSINGQDRVYQLNPSEHSRTEYPHLQYKDSYPGALSILGEPETVTPCLLAIPIPATVIKSGGNRIVLTILQGSWILFDELHLTGPAETKIIYPEELFLCDIYAADYELQQGKKRYHPLIVDVQWLSGQPEIGVELDGRNIYHKIIDGGRNQLEVPMPAVKKARISNYRITRNGREIASGTVMRNPQRLQTPAGYVDTRIGTAHSRWMIAPGPWMPFSMVKLSPDNQNAGWQAGYQPTFESIGCFSHIHEWTLGGLGIMAANGELKTRTGDEQNPDSGYRSRINKRTEEAKIGYYKAELTDYDVTAELTATTRAGLMRFTFPCNRGNARIIADFHPPVENDFQLLKVEVHKVSAYRLEGYSHQFAPEVWSHDACQDYTIHFVIEFNAPIKRMGHWIDGQIEYSDILLTGKCRDAGIFVEFDPKTDSVISVRTGISPVSIKNANQNLKTELSDVFGWDFNAVRKNQEACWNDIFNRISIQTDNRLEKVRFYNNMYRAICSRNTWSDVNGEWISTDKVVRKVENPEQVMLSCDAFWNTFWNLNPFWNLITPEWSSKWVKSQLSLYEANGWLGKGPAGLNYIPVMVAEHEIPMMIGAYQMGIRDYNTEKLFEAVRKMQTVPAQKIFNGYAGNRDLEHYLKHQYVPSDLGRFSNTMEYSFDDWTVGQLAKSLGKEKEYQFFNERGYWWRNAIDSNGYCHLRLSSGEWVQPFDPFRTGANHHYVEGNAWQLTYFVPQDIPALVKTIGRDQFIQRLEWGFKQSEPWRYNAPNDQYWDYPVVQGNQQSMHFAFLFNWAGTPWLTQKWSRSILERYYGYGIANAYLGDEDQGQMSAWVILASIGLFQTDGGTNTRPVYEIGSPIFEKTEIDLGKKYGRGKKFVIKAKGTSATNKYIQSATLNGQVLNSFRFPASELLKGGELILEMGNRPNYNWGVE